MASGVDEYIEKASDRFDKKDASMRGCLTFRDGINEMRKFFQSEIRLAYEQGKIDETRKETKSE